MQQDTKTEFTLPTEPREAVTRSPRKLVIYSSPKVGKTSLISGLPNSLLLDLEDGSEDVSNLMVLKVDRYQQLYKICQEIKAQGRPYKYIVLDTATALEDMIMPMALKMYQQTPMGKGYDGYITALPKGGGYLYVRQAYMTMLDEVKSACDRLILFGHIKDKFIERGGKEVAASEIDLTGRLKTIVCANADAIGYLYREKNQNMITFKTSEDIVCGARPAHIRNQTFVLSELKDDGTLEVYWDKIFID